MGQKSVEFERKLEYKVLLEKVLEECRAEQLMMKYKYAINVIRTTFVRCTEISEYTYEKLLHCYSTFATINSTPCSLFMIKKPLQMDIWNPYLDPAVAVGSDGKSVYRCCYVAITTVFKVGTHLKFVTIFSNNFFNLMIIFLKSKV